MEMDKHTTMLGQRFDNASMLNLPASARFLPDVAYRVLPEGAEVGEHIWRVVLMPVDTGSDPLALELRADVALGSWEGDDRQADVNLSAWDGYELGVSRRHLLLRTSSKKLFALELGSTNGTHVNGLPLGVGWAYALQDGDLLTLGKLHLRVRIVQRPSATPGA